MVVEENSSTSNTNTTNNPKPKPKPAPKPKPVPKPAPAPKPKPTETKGVSTSNTSKKKDENTNDNGPLDEKGNPFPIENKNGGDPTCPGGYKIDYDFDVFDPINPPFRCISALIDTSIGNQPNKIMEKLNDPASNVTGLAAKALTKPVGGRRYRSRHTRTRTRTRTRRRMNVKRGRRRSHRSSV
jgi:hypothetical protein